MVGTHLTLRLCAQLIPNKLYHMSAVLAAKHILLARLKLYEKSFVMIAYVSQMAAYLLIIEISHTH